MDTLLRILEAPPDATAESRVRVPGVDDWAWRKGQRYGMRACLDSGADGARTSGSGLAVSYALLLGHVFCEPAVRRDARDFDDSTSPDFLEPLPLREVRAQVAALRLVRPRA